MKKLTFLILGLFSVSLLPYSLQAKEYSDVSSDYKYSSAIQFMTEQGVIQGNPDGTYKPEKQLNRAELLKILIEAKYSAQLKAFSDTSCFQDVDEDQWFTPHVCFAKAKGIVQGYSDGTFQPSRKVNFVEAMKMTMKTYEYPYDETREIWYEDLVQKAADRGFVPLDVNEFADDLNRGQMADMITRVVKEEKDELPQYISEQVQYFENLESPLLTKLELGFGTQESENKKRTLPEGITFDSAKADEYMRSGELVFETSEKYPNCYGLSDHNEMDQNRINVVFIPAGYSSHKPVNEVIESMIDYDGSGNGMFSFEPYKSTKNKFNFWVSKDIFYEKEHQSFLTNQRYDLDRLAATQLANQNCPTENTIIVSPIRYPNCSVAHSATQSIWMSVMEDGEHPYSAKLVEDQDLDPSQNPQYDYDYLGGKTLLELRHAPTFVHELGHIFGLADEYVNYDTFNSPLTPEIKASSELNCYVGTKQECEANAPWKAYMDQGEGHTNVGCYEGCQYYGKGIYRPTPRSIMNAPEGMYYGPNSSLEDGDYVYYDESVTYGPYNEAIVKKAIEEMTQ